MYLSGTSVLDYIYIYIYIFYIATTKTLSLLDLLMFFIRNFCIFGNKLSELLDSLWENSAFSLSHLFTECLCCLDGLTSTIFFLPLEDWRI